MDHLVDGPAVCKLVTLEPLATLVHLQSSKWVQVQWHTREIAADYFTVPCQELHAHP